MRFITREENININYRKIEAMYRRGMNSKEIANGCSLPLIDVLDVMQKIFASDMKRRGL